MDLEVEPIEGLPPDMRLGRRELDLQHAGMFDRLRSLEEHGTLDEIRALVWDLMRYTREHFLAEETFMAEIGYPRLADHRELHDHLLKELVRIASRNLGVPDARLDLQVFVRKWLSDHIQSADRDIVDFQGANAAGPSV